MKAIKSRIFFLLMNCVSGGYAMEGDISDLSTSPVYRKIMSSKSSELVMPVDKPHDEDQKFFPKQDFNFDDSGYSFLSNSRALWEQKNSPKSVNKLDLSRESTFSTRSTVEFVGGNYYISSSDESFLAVLEQMRISNNGAPKLSSTCFSDDDFFVSQLDETPLMDLKHFCQRNGSVQSSVVFPHLRGSIAISVYSNAESLEG